MQVLGYTYDPAEWYSEDINMRIKANQDLLKEHWGYTRIYDQHAKQIDQKDFESFFKAYDESLTLDTIGEMIGRLVDPKLMKMVQAMQAFYNSYPDAIIDIRNQLVDCGAEEHPKEETVHECFELLLNCWEEHFAKGDQRGLNHFKDFKHPKTKQYLWVIGFLISRTMRDCSYLIRVCFDKNKKTFRVIEDGEEGSCVVLETDVAGYHVKGRNNLVDVALKFWEKLFGTIDMYRKVNEAYVEHYLGVDSWINKITCDHDKLTCEHEDQKKAEAEKKE